MNEKQKNLITDYVIKLIDETIKPQEFEELNAVLSSDPQAAEHYNRLMMMIHNFQECPKEIISDNKSANLVLKKEFWQAFAEDEKTAPVVQIPQKKQIEEPIEEIGRQSVQIKINRGSLITILLSVAAMLLFVLAIRFVPSKSGIEVATLTDSIKAKWAEAVTPMGKGVRLATGSTGYLLREGIAQIEFDNQAKVTIEAPSEFEIVTGDQVKLNYGRLYATVPQSAIGFAVQTQSARIIDLGTEFGIDTNSRGDTSLHVIKGKTTLIAGEKSNKTSMEVIEGAAKKVSFLTQTVSDIPCDENLFARGINSRSQVIWRGEPLDLASIIAGGNGFVPVLNVQTLNPNTGSYETKPLVSSAYQTNASYNRVPNNLFIDGVFVPDGSNGPVTITSQGHHFNCPATARKFNRNIAVFYKPYDKTFSDTQPAAFDGVVYGSEKRPCVLLHSNIGITIDLNHIRQAYPGLNIEQLQTGYGLTWAEKRGRVDFYVLVDGILKHENKSIVSRETSWSATIKLEPNARFLTFIVTDDQKSSLSPEDAQEYDFFYLLNPQLILH